MRYRVTQARVMTGSELKASVLYEAGQIVDEAVDPLGHIPRLMAAGVLEALPEAPPAAPARRREASR